MGAAWLQKTRSKGEGGGEEKDETRDHGSICTALATHIHDLPDDCLADILRRVGDGPLPLSLEPSSLLLATTTTTTTTAAPVRHRLQCALVCQRWRSVADLAISDLDLTLPFTDDLARHLSSRFNNLASLTVHNLVGDALLGLVGVASRLERFELRSGFRSPVASVARALATWQNLKHVNLQNHIYDRQSDDVQTTLSALAALPTLHHLGFRYGRPDLPDVCACVAATLTALTTLHLACPTVPFIPEAGPHNRFSEILKELVLVDVPGTRLTEDSLSSLTALEALILIDAKHLTSLPSTLGRLTGLKTLRVIEAPAMLAWPEEGLQCLRSLQTLVIFRCGSPPHAVGGLSSLDTLRIDGFARLPEDIGDLPRLRSLELLNGSGISALPPSLSRLGTLRTFRLNNCPSLSLLPAALFAALTALRTLRLTWCGKDLEAFPGTLSALTALEACKVDSLPKLSALLLPTAGGGGLGVATWRKLTSLEIAWCAALRALPEEIGDLSAVAELRLKGCSALGALPEGLGRLGALRLLRIELCLSLVSLPESLGGLAALRALHVIGCKRLAKIPADAVSPLGALAELEIAACGDDLAALPEAIGRLTRLEICKLGLPGCRHLPQSLGQWERLRSLEIVDCDLLEGLPEGLGGMSALRELRLVGCPSLVSLPQSLGALESLLVLELRGCPRLTKLRRAVEELRALRVLEITDCNAVEYLPLGAWRQRGLRVERSYGYHE